MGATTFVIICSVVFCAAVFLTSIFNRPVVVLKNERDDSGGSCALVLGGLLFVACLVIWFLVSKGETDESDVPVPKKEIPPSSRVQDTLGDGKGRPPTQRGFDEKDTMSPPIINRPPAHSKNASGPIINEPRRGFDPYISTAQEEAWPQLKTTQSPKRAKSWLILVKRFVREEDAKSLKKHFSKWEMQIGKVKNEYWNVILVDSEEEAWKKIKEWRKDKQDFQHMNLLLEVRRLRIAYDDD